MHYVHDRHVRAILHRESTDSLIHGVDMHVQCHVYTLYMLLYMYVYTAYCDTFLCVCVCVCVCVYSHKDGLRDVMMQFTTIRF